jgi:hypothetical protein
MATTALASAAASTLSLRTGSASTLARKAISWAFDMKITNKIFLSLPCCRPRSGCQPGWLAESVPGGGGNFSGHQGAPGKAHWKYVYGARARGVNHRVLTKSSRQDPATPPASQAWHRSPALTGLSWPVADPDPDANRLFSELPRRMEDRTSQRPGIAPTSVLGQLPMAPGRPRCVARLGRGSSHPCGEPGQALQPSMPLTCRAISSSRRACSAAIDASIKGSS